MKTNAFRGKDFFTLMDLSKEEIETYLEVATELKRQKIMGVRHSDLLKDKSLFLFFYNRSTRTRNSFETGMTQLGGHANFLDTDKIYTPALEGLEQAYSTERVSDTARVLSRIGDGIAIRCYGNSVGWNYGAASGLVREFAKWADIPVINMEDDKFHPTQALADGLTIKEKFGGYEGLNFVMSWAYSPSTQKPRAVPHSSIILATKLRMNVTLAYPEGMELDDDYVSYCQELARKSNSRFEISNDFKDSFKDAHIVYPKAWAPRVLFQPPVGNASEQEAQEIFDKNRDWRFDSSIFEITDRDAIYMHCLPADRGFEATDEVMDGEQSVIFDQAENRLHTIKAILTLHLA